MIYWRQLVWSGRIDLFNDSLYNALDDLYRFISGIEIDRTISHHVIHTKLPELKEKLQNVLQKLEKE